MLLFSFLIDALPHWASRLAATFRISLLRKALELVPVFVICPLLPC
jgi:hypothetical protein